MKKLILVLLVSLLIFNMSFRIDQVQAQNINSNFKFYTKKNLPSYRSKKKKPKRPGIKNPKVGGPGNQASSSSSSGGGNTSSGGNDSSSGGNGGGGNNIPPPNGGGNGNPPFGGGGMPPGGGVFPPPVLPPSPDIECQNTAGNRPNETTCCRRECDENFGDPGEPGFEACVAGCICEVHSGNGGNTTECFDNCEVNTPHNQYCVNMADREECCRATCISMNCPSR